MLRTGGSPTARSTKGSYVRLRHLRGPSVRGGLEGWWTGWDAAGSSWGLSWAEELPRFRQLHYCAHSSHTHGFDAAAPMTPARMQGWKTVRSLYFAGKTLLAPRELLTGLRHEAVLVPAYSPGCRSPVVGLGCLMRGIWCAGVKDSPRWPAPTTPVRALPRAACGNTIMIRDHTGSESVTWVLVGFPLLTGGLRVG